MRHRYLPIGDDDRREMLEAIGVDSEAELFASLPASVRLQSPPEIQGPLSDQELRRYFGNLERRNRVAGRDLAVFLGAGAYRHETPAACDHLIQRGEFLTVYTPYQPEMSQGTLQAIFEFQTLISELTGLPVANASLYDGASAFAEAVLMARRVQRKRRKVIVARSVHPDYRRTLSTYVQNLALEIVEIGWDEGGRVDRAALEAAIDEDTIAVAVQSPNYFGVVEDWRLASDLAHGVSALSIGVVAEALSLALLSSPGVGGCDLAVGEAQSFGLPLNYGGPYLGFLACAASMTRAIPGRLVGETVDLEGRRAFVLTLSTREQHIRRDKATSNICTNQSLCALLATIYLALHGRVGLRQLAEVNLQRTAHLARRLTEVGGAQRRFDGPFFNEICVRTARPVDEVLRYLEGDGLLAGVPLGADYPELAECFLVAVTECNPPEEIARLVDGLRRAGSAEGAS